jgi:hypothetical protein
MGLLFYILELPFVFEWSIPFMLAGLVFLLIGALAKETTTHIEPPPGYNFCVFCGTAILIGTKKCDRCGGTQPT